MWCSLVIVLFVGTVGAEHFGAWMTDTEYQYNVDLKTISILPSVSDTHNRIILKALLTVRSKDGTTLEAKISEARYVSMIVDLHHLSPIEDTEPDNGTEFKQLMLSEKVFLIRLRNGDISELIMNNDVPTWQVNLFKSIISQLQISSISTYTKMETSVSGRCEVKYMDFAGQQLSRKYFPMPNILGSGEAIKLVKKKNYCNCEQRPSYHSGNTESSNWENCQSGNGSQFLTIQFDSAIYITTTGSRSTYTIQSSSNTHQIFVYPDFHENLKGAVISVTSLSLAKMDTIVSDLWMIPSNLQSVGNLVYNYNSPFDQKYDIDNDNGKLCWQSRQNLNEAPATLHMPFFVGYREQPISSLDEIDPVRAARMLVINIGMNLAEPNSIPAEQTLEKFTILADVLRTMTTEQIAKTEQEIVLHRAESGDSGTWPIFRDAVAQAGTGPALMTIMNWISEKKIKSIEAASVVGVLSTTARTPTPEYMDAFFKMVTMPSVSDEEFLNATAITTFAELVGYTQVNLTTTNNNGPVYCFGRFAPKYNPAILSDYIPYLSEQLEKSIMNNENAKSHVFIHALGQIAHPQILTIFEPYLGGVIQTSPFQRLLMVFSMRKLATVRPSLVQPILYNIYKNTHEAGQIRAAAVAFLMLTDPPETMLREMIAFINEDRNKIVNDVVSSSIESASALETSAFLHLQKKALNVLHLLNDTSECKNAINVFGDHFISKLNLAYNYQNYVNCDDFITLAYSIFEATYGDMKIPLFEIGAILAKDENVERLCRNHLSSNDDDQQENNNSRETQNGYILKLLKSLHLNKKIQPEGAFWMKTKYTNRFISYDKHNVHRIPELLMKASSFFKEGGDVEALNIASDDLTISFPMESGFPFLYTRKVPSMIKVSASTKVESAPDFIRGVVDLSLVYSNQIQARLGFLTPFDAQYNMVGVNKNFQAYVPVRADFNYEKTDQRAMLKLQAPEQNKKYKLLHSSVVPFVSRKYILSMLPVMVDENSRRLGDRFTWFHSREMGISFEIEEDSDALYNSNPKFLQWVTLKGILAPFTGSKIKYSKSEVYLSPEESETQTVIFTLSFESLHSGINKHQKNEKRSCFKIKAPIVSSNKINDPERRSALLKGAINGIPSVVGFAYDFGIEISGQTPVQYVVTSAAAASTIDRKLYGMVYSKLSIPDQNMTVEQCVGYGTRSHRLYREIIVDWRMGQTCENGDRMQINGKQEQTTAFSEDLLKLTNECAQAMRSGSESDPHCRNNFLKTSTLDKSRLDIKFSPNFQHIIRHLTGTLYAVGKVHPYTQSSYIDDKSIDEGTVRLSMDLVPLNNSARFSFQSSDFRGTADFEVNQLISMITNTGLNDSMNSTSISIDKPVEEDECLLNDEETDVDVDSSLNSNS